MKNRGRTQAVSFVLTVAMVMTLTFGLGSGTAAAAEPDYSAWNTQSVYPQDVMNTPLMTPVKSLMDRKIITGDSDGLFHPEKNISRAEFATMMAKATNNVGDMYTMKNLKLFTDVPTLHWASGYINACAKAKLIEGVGANIFMPDNSVTYAQVITIIIRGKAVAGGDLLTGTWPDNYIRYAQMYNMTGDVQIRDWNEPATKGDVAKLLYRNLPKPDASKVAVEINPTATSAAVGANVTLTSTIAGGNSISVVWLVDGVIQQGQSFRNFVYKCTGATGDKHIVTVKVTSSETGKADVTASASCTVTVS